MDQPDIPLRSEASLGGVASLEQRVRSLQGTVTMLLIAVFCIGAAVTLYLYRQVTQINVQVTEAKRVLAEYETNSLPRIRWFISSLQNFGRTNTDFNPILAKYGLLATNSAPPASPTPGAKR